MTEKDLDVAIEKCERIMEMDTRTMQNPVSENGWIFEKVYELLQYLRQFQFATDTNVGGTDTISRQAALDALAEAMPSLTTPDGCGQFDHDIQVTDEAYVDCMRIIHDLSPAQPGWIPWNSGKFPEESGTYTVTVYDGATKRVTYAKYQKRLKRWELTGARAYWRVLAWMPHIEPWEGGQDGTD